MDSTERQGTTPPPEPAPDATGDTAVTMQRPVIIAILYLLNFVLGFSVLVGVILAYVWRAEARTQEWEKTHYTYLIRTFWIGFAIFVGTVFLWFATVFGTVFANMEHAAETGQQVAAPMAMFGSMFGMMALFLLSAAWFAVRCILSLVKAGDRQPMPRPKTWLF